mgnify:CR=1 FL=1|jgi:hypothetical protein
MGRSDPIKSIGLNVKVYLYDADKNGQFIRARSREVSQNRLIYQKKGSFFIHLMQYILVSYFSDANL